MIRFPFRELLLQARNGASSSWTWWIGELAAMTPPAIARYFVGDSGFLLRVGSDGVVFHGPSGSVDVVGHVSSAVTIPADLLDRLRRSDSIILLLPTKKVLRRAVDLPLAAASDLSSAVPFQIERQTPFRLDNASYTYRVLGRNKLKKTVRIELAVTSKTTIDSLLSWLTALDVPISAVRVDGDDLKPLFHFDFRGRMRRRLWDGSWLREPWKPILAATLSLVLIGPWLIDISLHQQVQSIDVFLSGTKAKARADERLRTELSEAIAESAFVHDLFLAPRAIEALNATTRALPDDSWAFSWEMNAGEVHLSGFSANVPEVVERLQSAPIFRRVVFASPVVHDARNHQDRFEVLVEMRQGQNATHFSH